MFQQSGYSSGKKKCPQIFKAVVTEKSNTVLWRSLTDIIRFKKCKSCSMDLLKFFVVCKRIHDSLLVFKWKTLWYITVQYIFFLSHFVIPTFWLCKACVKLKAGGPNAAHQVILCGPQDLKSLIALW